jgi:hypothetical protein
VLNFLEGSFTSSIGLSWTAAGGTGRAHQTLLRPWSPGKLAEIDSRAVMKRLTSGVMAPLVQSEKSGCPLLFPNLPLPAASCLDRSTANAQGTDPRGRAQAASRTVRRLASVSFSGVDSTPKTSELCASAERFVRWLTVHLQRARSRPLDVKCLFEGTFWSSGALKWPARGTFALAAEECMAC